MQVGTDGDWRYTPVGTVAFFGVPVIAAWAAWRLDESFGMVARVLWALPAVLLVAVAVALTLHAGRSRGRRRLVGRAIGAEQRGVPIHHKS
ncbi:hypothetical protein [Kribbella flavida]|uniref:hypothetical protein n=1 Tax=Kribbella flavida TaxID=182640 RepID=UPI0011D19F5A|nr:hypothetical protein [Kribbella flavida]